MGQNATDTTFRKRLRQYIKAGGPCSTVNIIIKKINHNNRIQNLSIHTPLSRFVTALETTSSGRTFVTPFKHNNKQQKTIKLI